MTLKKKHIDNFDNFDNYARITLQKVLKRIIKKKNYSAWQIKHIE